MHCGAFHSAFLLSLIFAGRRRTLNLQIAAALWALLRSVATRLARAPQLYCRSWWPWVRCHARLHGSVSFLVSVVSWLRPSSSSRNMVTACNNPLGCPAVLLVLRLDKASSFASTLVLSLRPIRSSVDGLQVLASLPN